MGVPGYFIDLIKRYPHIIRKFISSQKTGKKIQPYGLYIDGNCGIHPKCFEVIDIINNDDSIDSITDEELEELMFIRIIDYFDYLIQYTFPSTEVHIDIDGVAPRAKISQQRKRRFGYANDYRKIISKKHGKTKKIDWSNIVVTPGTDFMLRLKDRLENYYKYEHFKKYPKATYKIVISSYCIPGEGEHKILQHIKKETNTTLPLVIYGLDADLVFLALAASVNSDRSMYLLREADQFSRVINEDHSDVTVDMLYVDIKELENSINKKFQTTYMTIVNGDTLFDSNSSDDEYEYEYEIGETSFTMDYIFICYLLGNDFLPHLPSIDIKMNGMNYVINAYMNTLCEYNSVMMSYDDNSKLIIDVNFLRDFIIKLGDIEEEFFQTDLVENIDYHEGKRCYKTDPYEKDIWLVENLKCTVDCFGNLKRLKLRDPVRLGQGKEDEWKHRYYKHYFHTDSRYEDFANKLSHNYIEGLFWVAKYYFEECTDWRWQYNYSHAPFLSDIVAYIKSVDLNKINEKVRSVTQSPVDIYSQLVSVIPNKYCHILPENLRHLTGSISSPIIDMYPIDYKLDMIYKTVLYKCIPDIPNLNLHRIEKAINDVLEERPYTKKDIDKIKDMKLHIYKNNLQK